MNKRRVFAWIAIVLLAGMYLACLVLALIGSEAAKLWLKIALVCTMVIPLVLYGFLVLTKANMRSGKPHVVPDEEPEEPSGEGLIAREAGRTAEEFGGIREEAFVPPEEPFAIKEGGFEPSEESFRTEGGAFTGAEEMEIPAEPGMPDGEVFGAETGMGSEGNAEGGEGDAV